MKTKLLSSHQVTKLVLFGAAAFLVCGFLFAGSVAHAATINVPTDQSTIQGAINAATTTGDTINVASGTYSGALNLNGKSLTIVGAGSDLTIIDASSSSDYAIQNFGASSTIRDLKLIGSHNYGFKVSHVANITLENIKVENSKNTGIDLNTVTGANLSNITVSSTTNGFGLMILDSQNVHVSNVTTNGNAWGGVSVQTKAVASDGVSFAGTFDASESLPLLLENDPDSSSAYHSVTNISVAFAT